MRKYEFALAAILLFLSSPSLAEDWFLSAPSNCSGITSVSAGLHAMFEWKSPVFSAGAADHLVFPISPTLHNRLNQSGSVEFEEVLLDEEKSESIRSVLRSATGGKVPLWFKALTALFGNVTIPSTLANVGVGLLFDRAYEELDAASIELDNAIPFIAKGGVLSRVGEIRAAHGQRFLLLSTRYQVSVGEETRTITFSACLLPAPIHTEEFQALGQFNNKRVLKQPDGSWKVWDIEDAKWDKSITYSHQELEFYYFSEPYIENNQVTGLTYHRLSLVEGPWQRKSPSDSSFKTLYANVVAK